MNPADSGKRQYKIGRELNFLSQSFVIHGLRPTALSYWNNKIEQMTHAPEKGSHKQISATRGGASGEVPQAPFIRFSVPCSHHDLTAKFGQLEQPSRQIAPLVATELINQDNGRTLRIFNGAEPATVEALAAQF